MKRPENIKTLRMIKKIRLFLIFFGLSVVTWFFSAMSSEFSYDTMVKLTYQNDVKTYFLQEKPLQKAKIKVKTNGFNLFYLYFFPKTIQLNYSDFDAAGNFKHYFLPNKNIRILQKQWHRPQMVAFERDTIWLSLGELQHKKIPVISQIDVQTKSGYLVKEPLKLIPDSITVIGPEKLLQAITSVETEQIYLTDIHSDISQMVLLNITETPAQQNVIFSDTLVKATGKVSKFTEVKMELPVLYSSLNTVRNVEVFPRKAILYYLVSFEDFTKVHPFDFELSAVVSDTAKSSQKLAVLAVTKKPEFVKISRIEPDYVNYLIKDEKN